MSHNLDIGEYHAFCKDVFFLQILHIILVLLSLFDGENLHRARFWVLVSC
jgi:hypothetical protein